ncbi:NIP100 [Candida margitis]|uniref:NIP100 n=1 Tax=Candida margitis TaxID=1775924 RepID=UPI002225FE8A|nr:NIP100 [Candida margitis]KAI5969674.1 NIP100 [Candida margitis]
MRYQIGDHVKVRGESGRIRYVGGTEFASGTWFGVELDNPVGKNDGSVQGVQYFQCQRTNGLYGVFVKENLLEVVDKASRAADATAQSLPRLQNQLKVALSENSLCKNELKKLKGTMAVKIREKEQLESKLEMQSVDNQYLSEAKHVLEAKVAELTQQYQSLQQDYTLVLEELEIGRELEKELRFVDVDAYTPDEIKLLIEKVRLDERTIADLNKRTRMQEEKLSVTLEQLQTTEDRIQILNSDLSDKNSTVIHLKERLETFAELEQMTEKLAVENGELLETIKELEKSIEELSQLHALDTKIEANLHKTEQNLRQEIESLQDTIVKDKSRIKELESKIASSVQIANPVDSKFDARSANELSEALETANQQLAKLERRYLQCSVELQICEYNGKIDIERVKFHASSSLKAEYIDLIYDVKLQCNILDLLNKQMGSGECFLFCKYAITNIRHFYQAILILLEYNYKHKLSEELFKQNRTLMDTVQEETEKIISLMKVDSSEKESIGMYRASLKNCLDLCSTCVTKMCHDSEERPYVFQHSSIVKHVEFSMSKFLVYLNDVASLHDRYEEFSDLIQSVKSIKSRYEMAYEYVLSQSTMNNASIKSLSIPSSILRYITDLSIQIVSTNNSEFIRLDDLKDVLEGLADSEVHMEQELSATDVKSVYEYVQEEPIVKEHASAESVNVKDDSELTEVILSKDKEISELKLNIALLEQNMKLFTKQTMDQIEDLEQQILVTKAEIKEKSAIIATLQKENKALRNQSFFNKASFDEIESQKDFDEKLKRMETLIELKRQATASMDVDDDLSWLAFPKRPKIWKKPTQLQSLSHEIRDLAMRTQFIRICGTNKQKWVPQRTTARYINACIDERFTRYTAQKGEML